MHFKNFKNFKNFPKVDSAFGYDFTVLRTFVLTDTLEHLKNCTKEHQEICWCNVETASDATNHFKNFPKVDSAFGYDFTVLRTFVLTDTLEHLKNC